jgi:hypothetical protein
MKTVMLGYDEKMHKFFIQNEGVVELFDYPPQVLFGVTKFLKEIQDGQANINRSNVVGKPSSDIVPKPEEPNR